MEDITVTTLKKRMDQGESIILIDVREPYEHEDFNIGGQLIPLGELPGKLTDLEAHKDEEIVVYCRSGNRSGSAKSFMSQSGFTKVRNLLGGMLEWQDEFA